MSDLKFMIIKLAIDCYEGYMVFVCARDGEHLKSIWLVKVLIFSNFIPINFVRLLFGFACILKTITLTFSITISIHILELSFCLLVIALTFW